MVPPSYQTHALTHPFKEVEAVAWLSLRSADAQLWQKKFTTCTRRRRPRIDFIKVLRATFKRVDRETVKAQKRHTQLD